MTGQIRCRIKAQLCCPCSCILSNPDESAMVLAPGHRVRIWCRPADRETLAIAPTRSARAEATARLSTLVVLGDCRSERLARCLVRQGLAIWRAVALLPAARSVGEDGHSPCTAHALHRHRDCGLRTGRLNRGRSVCGPVRNCDLLRFQLRPTPARCPGRSSVRRQGGSARLPSHNRRLVGVGGVVHPQSVAPHPVDVGGAHRQPRVRPGGSVGR